MATYAKIYNTMFEDEKIASLPPLTQHLLVRILCHPHITRLGTLRFGPSALAEGLGWDEDMVSDMISDMISKGVLKRSVKPALLWVPDYLIYNEPNSYKVVLGWVGSFDLIPKCPLKIEIIEFTKTFIATTSEPCQSALESVLQKIAPYAIEDMICDMISDTICHTIPDTSNRNSNRKRNSSSNTIPPSPFSEPPEKTSIQEIFEHWQRVMNSPRSKLDAKRIKFIKKALGMEYSVAELCQAITGCSLSPYHMGGNEDNQKYNGLDLILRDAEHIDKFMSYYENPPVANHYKPSKLELSNGAAVMRSLKRSLNPNEPGWEFLKEQPQQSEYYTEPLREMSFDDLSDSMEAINHEE